VHKKNTLIIVLLIVIIGLGVVIAVQNQKLNQYKDGFELTGTYERTVYDDESGEWNSHYLVFEEDMDGQLIFSSYRQFEDIVRGTYYRTESPNVYFVEYANSKGLSTIVFTKDMLYFIEGTDIHAYEKISEGGVFINTDDSEI